MIKRLRSYYFQIGQIEAISEGLTVFLMLDICNIKVPTLLIAISFILHQCDLVEFAVVESILLFAVICVRVCAHVCVSDILQEKSTKYA